MASFSGFSDKFQAGISKVQNNRYIKSITGGLSALIPVMVVGAFSSLLTSMQIGDYQKWIAPIKVYLNLPYEFTTNVLAIYAVFMIAYRLAETFEVSGVQSGLIALISFLIVTPVATFKANGVAVQALTFDWLGAKGLFAAFIIGLVSARLYVWIVQHHLTIKMPAGVPPMISEAFASLVPAAIISVIFVFVQALFAHTGFGSLHQAVYSIVQTPLQGLGNTFGSYIIAVFLMQLLWVIGIHGAMVVLSIMTPIWTALDLQNLAAFRAGTARPNLITSSMGVFTMIAPMLGLVLVLLIFAKSKELRTIAKLGAPGALFGIHEPLLFGLPVVMNPVLAVPYVLCPIVCSVIGYLLTIWGILPVSFGITVPFGTPVFLYGLIAGSWKFAVAQVLLIPVCMLIWYPFVLKMDKQKLNIEAKAEEDLSAAEA
ncbi:PTS sugar transporter subunit IIC [Lacticaseibacillus suibinensis]|uniref:PTS sugar transporter subunit IIC n=1 Tax=Lacticaseibacillus suibinensis TaxID=2486011 RepID=UPI0019450005|nr:PTS transporter subunit EIIC [Lacticaseibacillus suibinensis]